MEQKQFTKAELARFNGQNGMPCYIAFDGKVYDVSDSTMWEDGNHQGVHDAGMDLTDEMDDAPHVKTRAAQDLHAAGQLPERVPRLARR